MLWFWVWTSLVVATLVGAFFLGRSLWVKAKALNVELQRASAVFEALGVRVAELEAAHTEPEPYAPDAAAARDRLVELRQVRSDRREERYQRHVATWARWRQLTR